MKDLSIPRDAFSHGQIRSKLWLSEKFADWSKKHVEASENLTLNWYGSWVGIGPFLLLSRTDIKFTRVNLFDLNAQDLEVSRSILDYWRCESIEIITHCIDVNDHRPENTPNQVFINSACEHMAEHLWLEQIPKGSFVLLQSTDMQHPEHVNCAIDLEQFINNYSPGLTVLESQQIDFFYPDKQFSRFMLFGRKK